MTYKLHAHLHLPEQCYKFGPLHKLSAFPFEGRLKIYNSYVHGTRGFLNQIYKHEITEKYVSFASDFLFDSLVDLRLRDFYKKPILHKPFYNRTFKSDVIRINQLDKLKQDLFIKKGIDLAFEKITYKGKGKLTSVVMKIKI